LEEEDRFFLASAGRGLGGIGFQGHTATMRGRAAGVVGAAVGLEEKLDAGVAGVADTIVGTQEMWLDGACKCDDKDSGADFYESTEGSRGEGRDSGVVVGCIHSSYNLLPLSPSKHKAT
jgi:hypothetical protein